MGWGVRGSNTGGTEIFRTRPDRPGCHPASYTIGNVSFTGVKRPGSGDDHIPPSSAELAGRVELDFFSPSGPSWPVLWRS